MNRIHNSLKSLGKAKQIVLAGSLLTLLAIFMPWHTIGVASLGAEHTYNGFNDQNMIIGIITFAFMFASALIVLLPMIGMRFPRTGWKESSMFVFLGGESALLLFVLTVMHATSLTRAASYDLRLGIHLALIGSLLVFIGGNLYKQEEKNHVHHHPQTNPLAHIPRDAIRRSPNELDLRDSEHSHNEEEKEDSRMQLDL